MGRIEAAITYVEQLFRCNAGGHDAAHTMRVYHNAMQLASMETECDREIVALAALLHDADDHKLFVTENNANARAFLTEYAVPPERIEQICHVINGVSFSQNRGTRPDTLEGKIVQDADRLDAIGAIGIARTFAYGGEHGRPLKASVDHFHEKLLLLKDEMNTDAAKEVAGRRHAFMMQFLKQLDEETEMAL
ncbi:MAG: HD domain-containing protein [Solobacterium sp.]|nr:HD domain-containing protein [Solobacterium sp.]